MLIGITGATGNLGSELVSRGCEPVQCDITDQIETLKVLEASNATTIINCASYNAVDDIEESANYKRAVSVNSIGVGHLALACEATNKRLIHLSTDYVFRGTTKRRGPYSEGQVPKRPVNDYGMSKFGGEVALRVLGGDFTCVVRTTGLYGGHKSDFVDYVYSSLLLGEEVKITKQLMGNQSYIPHVANGLLELASRDPFPSKILHIASVDVVSRYEFACMIANKFELDKELIIPVMTSELGWKAHRPTMAGLKTKLAIDLGIPIYTIWEGLEALKDDSL